jgi:hypothetical protein
MTPQLARQAVEADAVAKAWAAAKAAAARKAHHGNPKPPPHAAMVPKKP